MSSRNRRSGRSRRSGPECVPNTVLRTILDNGLFAVGDTVVVGVSGGPDSLCLLHVLLSLQPRLEIQLHVAHLNHNLRGEEADADASFVADLAQAWNVPATIERFDVPALARTQHMAVEEAARCARYGFLARTAARLGAAHVAVAHNADDQTETVLMHWLRGAGLSGLRGMLPVTPLSCYRLPADASLRGALQDDVVSLGGADASSDRMPPQPLLLVRPLLRVPRTDVEAYCQHHRLGPRHDRSNLDTTYFRNRLRHELIPQLETYNSNIREVIRRAAEVAAGDYALLQEDLALAWPRVACFESARAIRFQRDVWDGLPLGLKRATVREAIHRLRHELRNIDFVHIENALDVAQRGQTGTQATLPQGLLLTVGYTNLEIADTHLATLPDIPLLLGEQPVFVRVPGETTLPGVSWAVIAEPAGGTAHPQARSRRAGPGSQEWDVVVDRDAIGQTPYLRRRRPGDRFCPLGMGGRRKRLNEFLINEKVPADWREYIPIMVGAGDAIVWVAGWRIDDRAKVTPATCHSLRLRFVRT